MQSSIYIVISYIGLILAYTNQVIVMITYTELLIYTKQNEAHFRIYLHIHTK